MTDEQLRQTLSQLPTTPEAVLLQAYQLGRLLGRNEYKLHSDPPGYDALCDFVADKTSELLNSNSVEFAILAVQ